MRIDYNHRITRGARLLSRTTADKLHRTAWRSSVKTPTARFFCVAFALFFSSIVNAEPPRTVAEKSDYKATSRHADVMDFCQQLAKESKLVRLGELGTSQEGRKLPLII